MQESYYRITIGLKGPAAVDRREEMLEKIERFKDDLKKRGHTGRYGLQNLVCHAIVPLVNAECVASTIHPESTPWLQDELERLTDNEHRKVGTLKNKIEEQITKFKRTEDKEKFIADLKPADYEFVGISYNENLKEMEPEEYLNHLDELYNQPENYSHFKIYEVIIEPVKPSKKELENERTFLRHLSEAPLEKEKYRKVLEDKFFKDSKIRRVK
jgi:hypothetical protein